MANTAETRTDPMVPVLATVRARDEDIPGVVTLTLDVPGWPGSAPGQFNMLGLFGVGEVPVSISGAGAAGGAAVHTIRDVGAVTHALTEARPGAVLTLRGPYGAPWPVDAARGRDVVVVAGGLGLAPVRPILYHILANRGDYGAVTLLYGARSPSEMLFAGELAEWRARFDLDVEVTVDQAGPGWHGPVGVVTTLFGQAAFDPARCTGFICGPEIMMRFAANALSDAGVPDDAIFLSMERNMQCAIGLCGHCQLGAKFVCKDGPVFDWATLRPLMRVKEL